MSEQGRNIAIGAFVVGAALILIALVLFVNTGGLRGKTSQALVVFQGSVKGLKVGAPLAFKGVQIGTVTHIGLVMNTDTYEVMMPVKVQYRIDAFDEIGSHANDDDSALPTLIKKGLRAQLQSQSLLTGLLYVQLDFHPNTEVRLVDLDYDLEQFPAIATDMEKLSRNLQEVDFEVLLGDIRNSLAGLDQFINNPEFQALSANLNTTLEEIRTLAANLKGEVERASPGLNSLVNNADATFAELHTEIPKLATRLDSALVEAGQALEQLESTITTMDATLSEDSTVMYEVSQAAKELSATARAVRSLAETLEEQPESILKGKSPLEN